MSTQLDLKVALRRLGRVTALFALSCSLFFPSQACADPAPAKLKQISLDFSSVAKKAIPSVVSIKVKGSSKKASNSWGFFDDDNSDSSEDFLYRFFGFRRKDNEPQETPIAGQASGFIVSPDGYILTNSHVVKDASEIIVALNDGTEYPAKLIGQDPNTDIAIVKIEAKNLPYLVLGNSDDLEVGQWVVAIGNPLGLQASLTAGIVSAKGRNNLDLARIEDFIQTDAAINRGNSGGPLLDLESEVIGMNTAIVTNMATGGYMGIGFAIPSNLLKHVMDELISTGTVSRGFLGVTLQQVDNGLAKAFGLEKSEGALVAEVSRGSPAEKAGLKQGDVIIKYNNQSVNSIASLRNAVSLMKPGAQINLTILRDGKTIQVPVDIGLYPKEQTLVTLAKENKYGFDVANLTPEIAQSLGFHEDKGVVITKVDPNSSAAWAGIKKGSLIIAVNQKKVSNIDEFNQALESTEKNKPLLLLLKQGDAVRFVSLQTS